MHTYGECKQCKAAIPPLSAACPVCGASTSSRARERSGPAPVIPPAPPKGARRPKKPLFSRATMIALVLALGGVFALVVVAQSGRSGSSSRDDDDDDGKKKGGDDDDEEDEDDAYKKSAEPKIPASVASGRVDPRDISRGKGRAVKASAKEIDKASALSYSPDSDPYCKNQGRLTDIVKTVGYDIDRELRKAASISDQEEEQIGDKLYAELLATPKFRNKVDTESMAEARRYIAELAVPLLASVERKGIVYDFHTVDDDDINAFAMPGGHIYFYRGILEAPKRLENEAQIAGVLAHEINHIDRRHTIAIFEYLKRLGELSGRAEEMGPVIIGMARHPFSTKQEDESDQFAVKFLMSAEYSPKQFVTMWQNWDALDSRRKKRGGDDPIVDEIEELLNTHSHPARRACNAMRVIMANEPKAVSRYYVGTTNYRDKQVRARKQH